MKKTGLSSILLLCGLFIIISCARKDSSPSQVEELIQQSEKDAVFETVLNKADDQINSEITKLEKIDYNILQGKSGETEVCSAKISVETPTASKFPKTITLDFGTGCTDPDGNFRAGKIIVHITGPYWETNTERHAKLVDYRYNDLKISGERVVINKGLNENGYVVFELINTELIGNSNGELLVERKINRTRICNRGANHFFYDDNEVWITGSSLVKKDGKEVVQEITTPLYRKITCQNFQSGVITTYAKKVKIAELDYGNGVCDNKATWTNGTITKEITLKSWINIYSIKP
jgi:hypothetical protein